MYIVYVYIIYIYIYVYSFRKTGTKLLTVITSAAWGYRQEGMSLGR